MVQLCEVLKGHVMMLSLSLSQHVVAETYITLIVGLLYILAIIESKFHIFGCSDRSVIENRKATLLPVQLLVRIN
jgi:hypothetical protein